MRGRSTTVTVNVTAEDIAKGERENCTRCPIALAVKRALPNIRYVGVGACDSEVIDVETIEGYRQEGDMPRAAESFVEAFDAGSPVEPFTFEFNLHDMEP